MGTWEVRHTRYGGGSVAYRGYGSGGNMVVCHGSKGCLDHWILRSSPLLLFSKGVYGLCVCLWIGVLDWTHLRGNYSFDAFSVLGPKTKVVENSFPDAWPPESCQTEFVCSSYGQNSEQVSGDLYL
ncbi:hypothetical protein Tco_1430361 [Tanacetum coccineum]